LFVTSQGSPYARFQRALKTGRASIAWSAALELEHIGLEDALALVLLIVDEPLYQRASARWLGRLCLEVPSITLRQAQLVLAALAGLPDRAAALALESSCAELGLQRAAAAARAAAGASTAELLACRFVVSPRSRWSRGCDRDTRSTALRSGAVLTSSACSADRRRMSRMRPRRSAPTRCERSVSF